MWLKMAPCLPKFGLTRPREASRWLQIDPGGSKMVALQFRPMLFTESFLTSLTSDLQCCCIVDTSQGNDSVASRERERLQDWSNRLRVGVRMGQDVPKNRQLLAPRGPRAKCGQGPYHRKFFARWLLSCRSWSQDGSRRPQDGPMIFQMASRVPKTPQDDFEIASTSSKMAPR